jgi:hypothetical protein
MTTGLKKLESVKKPHFGYTKLGHPVHAHRFDHMPDHSWYARFNKRLAVMITKGVGSMTCAYIFALIALMSLPAILTQAFSLTCFPHWLISASLISLVAWLSSYFLQLILLPVIQMGSNILGEASDARAGKTFDDTESILDKLDIHTAGGLAEVVAAIKELEARIDAKAKP